MPEPNIPNPKYRDTLFRLLIGEHSDIRADIATYLLGRPVSESEIVVNTLEDSIYSARRNDASFEVGIENIVLFEEQTVYARNMTTRVGLYAWRVLERYLATHDLKLHSPKVLPIPSVKCYALLLDKPPIGMSEIETFSEIYQIDTDIDCKLHWITSDEALYSSSAFLVGYVTFIDLVRGYLKAHYEFEEAFDCARRDLVDCWKYSKYLGEKELTTMSHDWLELSSEERGRQYGIEEGVERGEDNIISQIAASIGCSMEEVVRRFNLKLGISENKRPVKDMRL